MTPGAVLIVLARRGVSGHGRRRPSLRRSDQRAVNGEPEPRSADVP